LRAVISLVIALTIAPSLPFSPCGPHSVIVPAVFFLQFFRQEPDGTKVAMLFGVAPAFVVWLFVLTVYSSITIPPKDERGLDHTGAKFGSRPSPPPTTP
jgi:hypothetical protein